MRWFLGQEQAYRVFSTDNEEKLGDGLETVLGFFDVISYFGQELPKWGNVCQYRPILEATFLKFVRENMTSHMTGLNRKRNGTVKYMEVPNKNVRHHGQAGVHEPIHRSRKPVPQARKGRQASPIMRTRLIVVVNPIMPKSLKPNNQESRTSPRDEQSCCRCFRMIAIAQANSMFASCAEKNPMRGHARISQEQRSLTWHVERYRCCFFRKDILHPMKTDMEGPDGEEDEPMSSEPQEKSHPPEMEEPEFYPREEFNKYNYAVNLPEMADMAEGGELHVGQVDLHTNPNMLDSFGGANPSVIPQPGDEAVCEGVHGFSCMTDTLPKGVHLEVMNMQSRDTSFPYWPYKSLHGIWIPHPPGRLIPRIKSAGEGPTPPNRPNEQNPIPCNGGGWVNIDRILDREDAFPQNRYKKSDRFQIIADQRIAEHGNRDCRFLLRDSTRKSTLAR